MVFGWGVEIYLIPTQQVIFVRTEKGTKWPLFSSSSNGDNKNKLQCGGLIKKIKQLDLYANLRVKQKLLEDQIEWSRSRVGVFCFDCHHNTKNIVIKVVQQEFLRCNSQDIEAF